MWFYKCSRLRLVRVKVFPENRYFPGKKIFSCVWLHFKKCFGKYFLMFGCVLENTLENTFYTFCSYFLTFSRLPNEYIISFIPQNTNKTQKKIIKSRQKVRSQSGDRDLYQRLRSRSRSIAISEIAISIADRDRDLDRRSRSQSMPIVIAIDADRRSECNVLSLSLSLHLFASCVLAESFARATKII